MVESVGWFSQVNLPPSSNSHIFSVLKAKFSNSFVSRLQFFSVFSVSRLAGIDQAIHKLNVGHYTLDVKVSQLIDRLSKLDGEVQNGGRSYSRNTPECFIDPFFPSFKQLKLETWRTASRRSTDTARTIARRLGDWKV